MPFSILLHLVSCKIYVSKYCLISIRKRKRKFQFDVSINPNMQNKMFKSGKIK